MKELSILFVCMGNICRSPSAEGVVRELLNQSPSKLAIHLDSAGTHDYHIGEPPDPRSIEVAARRGYHIADLRARQVEAQDFQRFDLILAMDEANLSLLKTQCVPELQTKLKLMMAYSKKYAVNEVPDPYYGAGQGFDLVLDYLEDAGAGLLAELHTQYQV